MYVISKAKLKLKGILQMDTQHLKKQQLTAEQKTQVNRITRNEKTFNELQKILDERKLIFAKYGFQNSELEDDKSLKPILKGLYEKNKVGSMLVNEVWSKDQMREYLALSG